MLYMSGGQYNMPDRHPRARRAGAPAGRPALAVAWRCTSTTCPGLKVVRPSTPADAKGLLKSAIRDDNPVIFIESETLYAGQGRGARRIPTSLIPLGQAVVRREGTGRHRDRLHGHDVPRAGGGRGAGARTASRSRSSIRARCGRWTRDTIVGSVRKTHRAVVLEAGAGFAGMGSEIAAVITEHGVRRSRRAGRARHRRERPDALREEPRGAQDAVEGEDRGGDPARSAANAVITQGRSNAHAQALGGHGDRQGHQVAEEGGRPRSRAATSWPRSRPTRPTSRWRRSAPGVLRKILVPAGRQVPVGDADRRDRGAERGHRRRWPAARARDSPGARARCRRVAWPAVPPRSRASRAARSGRAGTPPPPCADRVQRRARHHGGGPIALQPRRRAEPAPGDGGRVKASPLARKIAAQSGVDLALVQGSGPGGRIIRRDVEAARPPRRRPAAPPLPRRPRAPEFVIPAAGGRVRGSCALSPMRARHRQAHAAVQGAGPALLRHRRRSRWTARGPSASELNALEGNAKISVTDLVMQGVRARAAAASGHQRRRSRAQIIRVHHRAHIGIAVALGRGLITPVLRDCDVKSLGPDRGRVARSRRARAGGKLRAPRCPGATFSDLEPRHVRRRGVLGDHQPAGGRDPGRGLGAARPVVDRRRRSSVGRRMMLTISCDHRVMDGAMGARFLRT